MKNLFTRLMLVAVAAMGFVACQEGYEDVTITPEAKEIVMTFVAEAPDTRTSVAIDGNVAKYSWSEGDKVGFYYVATDVDYKKKGNSKEAVIADDGTATFTASFTPKDGASSYNIGAFYPGNSWMSHATDNPFSNVNVKISNEQILTDGSFDPTADLMMSKPFMDVALDVDAVKTLEFTRIAAIGKMNLKLTDMVEGEVIQSVKFTLAEGIHFNGPVVLDLENSTYELGTSNTFSYVNLTGSLAANTDRTPIFFTCFPGEYSGAYTIEVETDRATYSKEGTLTTALVFTAGDVLNFNASVSNRVEKVVDTTPSITIDTTPVSFDYNAKEGTIAATLKNLEINDVTITSTADWLTATLTEDALNYNATANDDDERYATVTLSAEGIDEIKITFTQAAKPAEVTGVWTLVTDASTLAVDDQVVIVAVDYNYALSTTQNNNNRGQAAITKSGNTVSFNNDVQILTVEAGTETGTFAFNTGSGYLYAASSSSNYLRTEVTLSANSSWKITIDTDGVATIIAQGTNTRNYMQYNSTSSLFACYAENNNMKPIAIYYLDGEPDTTPRFTVTPTEQLIGAEGGDIQFTVTAYNGAVVTAATEAEWLEISNDGNTYTATASANTGATREATITFSADGCDDVFVTVSQDAKPTDEEVNTYTETFENWVSTLSDNTNSYDKSGTFDGVSESGITWTYASCGNPNQTKTDVAALKDVGLKYDYGVTIGKNGNLSATLPGGVTSISFYALTSSKGSCTVNITSTSGTTLKTTTISTSTKGPVEITDIDSNGEDITISFTQNAQNRTTVAGLVYTK